jgi:hypothetical protein
VVLGAVSAAVLAADGLLSPGGESWRALAACALLTVLGAAGVRLAYRLLPEEGLLNRITAALVLSVALGLTSATALGLLGRLTPRAFELVLSVAAALTLLVPGRSAPSARTITINAVGSHPAAEQRMTTHRAAAVRAMFLLLPLGLLLATTLSSLVKLRDDPPGAFSYDDTSYHLSTVAHWLHCHDLSTLKFSFGDPSTTFYPLGGELWAWILLAPFRDNDVLARWSQLPFALFTLVAVAALARRLGLSWQAALLAVISYWSVPRAFPDLALSAGNDHQLAFFMVAGADAALSVAARPERRRMAYAGVVLGLLLGTKYLAVLYAPLLVCVWFAARRDVAASHSVPPSPGRREGMGEGGQGGGGLALAGILLSAALLVGGTTYLRNAAVTGNPLFPAPVRVLGIQILPGFPEASLAARHGEEGGDLASLFWHRSDLLGPLFRWTLLPGAFLAAAAALWTWRRPGSGGARWGRAGAVLALLPFGIVAVFAGLHDHRDIRYVFAGLALAGVALAKAIELLPSPFRQALTILLSFAWALTALAIQTELQRAATVAMAALAASGLAAWLLAKRPEPGMVLRGAGQGAVRWLPLLLVIPAVLVVRSWMDSFESHRLDSWPDATALEQVTGAAPTVIANVGGNQPYLFAGRRLQNRVEIVPTRGPVEARTFDWRGTADFPFRGGRFPAWWRNLRDLGIELVVVDRSENPGLEGVRELGWMEAHPDRFQALVRTPTYEIWRVVTEPPPP